MSRTEWVILNEHVCPFHGGPATLEELRVYPADLLPEPSRYQVVQRRCSSAIACNLSNIPCRWAFTNPDVDPFSADF